MVAAFLHHFLKNSLAVIENPLVFQIVKDEFHDKSLRRLKTAIQIHGTDQGFQRIRYDRITAAATHHLLASSKKDKFRKTKFPCAVGKTLLTDHAGTLLSKLAFLVAAEFFVQEITADQFQNCITQKFQTFVASKFSKVFLICVGAVCHSLLQ